MSRRSRVIKKKVVFDEKYNSSLLAKFINLVMRDGKKSVAKACVYGALDIVKKKHNVEPIEIFNQAIAKVKPVIEVTSVRVGGANYQVPAQVTSDRGDTLAVRWIKAAAKSRSEYTMAESLAEEMYDAANGRGGAFKKCEDVRKMAEANRAFAHFSPRRSA